MFHQTVLYLLPVHWNVKPKYKSYKVIPKTISVYLETVNIYAHVALNH